MKVTPTPTSGAADLALRLRNACTSVRSKSYPLTDLIPLMQQAADALASAPAKPAAQQGVAYAATPTSNYAGRVYEEGFLIGTCPLYTADQLRAFADATHTLRASHGQAPATQQAGEPAGTVGYTVHGTQYVNWRTKPPAHGTPLYTTPQPTQTQAVALLDYAMQIAHERELRVTGFPHDEDGAKRVFEAAVMRHTATGATQADSVQEDAARYRWLRDGNDAKHGAAWHVAVNLYGCEWDAAIDAARKRGEKL